MSTSENISIYGYSDGDLNPSHEYLVPELHRLLQRIDFSHGGKRIFELGCGNGSVAETLNQAGFDVTGVDPSDQGINQAKINYPHLKLNPGSAYDDLRAQYGQFPAVVSLEVIEHVFDPRHYAATLYDLVSPGGHGIVSTPYHGYWKNLALALTGKMDAHFTALWDGGHIKFWSVATLSRLLSEAGFEIVSVSRVGRIPVLAKSMVLLIRKPAP